MAKNINSLTCWVVTEGMAGTENQCLGVAEALGITPDIKRISLTFPWNKLSPILGFERASTFSPKFNGPWPDLVLASGRKAISAARYIKKASKGKSFVVFIQDPRVNPKQFDLVAVPHHDKTRGNNVIVTDGAPNRITMPGLVAAKSEFHGQFSDLKNPRIAVLIGGDSNSYKLTPEATHNLCDQLKLITASLMITTSRRTSIECQKIIENQLGKTYNFIWDHKSKNPYFGMLAWADYIIVTEESTSMISDAGTTGKPVYIVPLEGGSNKFNRFHNHLKKRGVIKSFDGSIEQWEYEPLHDAQKIAREIVKKMGL